MLPGDTGTLATLLAGDLAGADPLRFVLPEAAWPDRHRQGPHDEQFT